MHTAATIDKHVGNRVRVRRLSLGISQQDLAEKLSLTFQQIQKYEKGANRIGASRLYELAALLQVDMNFFFEGLAGDSAAGGQQDQIISAYKAASPRFGTREFVDLNKAFQNIPNADLRGSLISLVEAIADQQDEDGVPPSAAPFVKPDPDF